jgi:hypothetical protein
LTPRTLWQAAFLAWLAGVTLPLFAAFDEQDRQLPLAADAASASAFSVVRQGSGGAVYNPAALGFGEDVIAALSGGNGGREADLVGVAALVWPLEDDLSLALAYRHLSGSGGPGFSEQSYGFSAALEPLPGLALGLRPWLHQPGSQASLQGGGLGFSMDVGARWRALLARRVELALGWWGSQLASEWPDRYWRRAVPVTQHGGLSLGLPGWGELGLGVEQSALADRDLPLLWRAGLTFTRFKALRPSVGASSDPRALLTAGVEAPFSLGRARLSAAYAVMLPSRQDGLRHRLQVSGRFQVRRQAQIVAVPLQVVYEPGTKKVKSATVSLNVADSAQVQEWELEIRDKSGRLVRVLRGTGVPPAFVTWDGKDALGEALADAEGISYQLNIKTTSGLRSSEPSFALSGELSADGLELLATSGGDALVVPVLDAEGQVTQLRLRPPAVPGETERWQILIQDADGRTLRTLDGVGPFPGELLWDGKDDAGRNVLDQPGLRVRFNAWDADSQLSSVDQGLDGGLRPIEEGDEPLPRLALKLPAFREGGVGLTLMLSSGTLKPLPVEVPTPRPTAAPTAVPTAVPTRVPPTAMPTRMPSVQPSPIPTIVQDAASIGSGLARPNYMASADLLPPVYMTRDQAEGTQPAPRRTGVGGRPRLPSAIDGVLDVFLHDSAELDPARADKLQAFFWRLGGFKARRILLTGLVGPDEGGSEGLSRQRVRTLSQLMVEEGGFEGEFILKVEGRPGPQKGVRVEVLRR